MNLEQLRDLLIGLRAQVQTALDATEIMLAQQAEAKATPEEKVRVFGGGR